MEDNNVDIYDNINTNAIKDGKLPEYIESVFKWQPHHSCPHESSDDIVIRLLEKDEEVISDSDFPWRSFIIQLTLCYELHRQNKYKESLAKIKECEVILKVQNSGTFDVIYNSISEALWHVTLACKAHLMLESGMLSEVNQALKTIKPPDSMDNRNLAGIYGIKAAVFMEYGFGGNKDAVEFAKLATIKDPKQAEWFFLYGKSLATCRRVFSYFKIIDDAEIKSMKEAVRLATLNSQKPFRYMLYLGNIYRECAFRIFKQNVTDKTFLHSNKAEQMDTINKKARDIYRTVIKHQSENARLLGRCCFGLLKMPTRVIDVDLINDVLEEAHRLAPNNMMILHVMGMFFERCKEDYENALKYYKMSAESGCYGAWLNLLKLKYHTSLGYDPMKEYNKILSHFRVTPRRHHTLCQIASYYLIQKRDVLQAVDYLMMVFDENPDSYEMQMFKANFVSMYNPVNILKVLIQEIQFILKTKSQQLENEDKKKLRKFIIKVNLHDSTLLTDELNSMSPVENIIKISKEIQSQPNNNRKKQTMRAQQQLKKKKEHQDRKRRSYKLRLQQLFKKNRKEEKIRRSYVVSGLPVDVAMRIRQAGIEKERVSCFKQRSLSETRQEEVNNKSSYKEFKQNFEKKNKLLRSASVDALVSDKNKGKVYDSDVESMDCSTDASESDIASGRTEILRRPSRRIDSRDVLKRASSVSSVDSDYENPKKDNRNLCRESDKKSWRSTGGDNRFFGDTNVITGNKIKRSGSVDSKYENQNQNSNTDSRERMKKPTESKSWRSSGGENRFFGDTNVITGNKIKRSGSVDSKYENQKQNSNTDSRERTKKPTEGKSWRITGGENRFFGDTNVMTGNKIKRSGSVDSDYENSKQVSYKESRARTTQPNEDKSWRTEDGNRDFGDTNEIEKGNENVKSKMHFTEKQKWSRIRADSMSSIDSDYENAERNLMMKFIEPTKGDNTSRTVSQSLDRKEKGQNYIGNPSRSRSYSTSANVSSFENIHENRGKQAVEYGNLRKNRCSEGKSESSGTCTRSYSMNSTPTHNLFKPDFITNQFKGKQSSTAEEEQKRQSTENRGWEGKMWARTRPENTLVSGNDKKSAINVKWGNTRWMTENVKETTSTKGKIEGVIREPYGPEEGKKGFKRRF